MAKMLAGIIIKTESVDFNRIFEEQGRIYTFLNPVSYLDALKNVALFSNFDGIFADGSILVKFIHLLYGKKITRRSFDMTSVAPLLFEYAVKNKKSVGIVASRQDELEKAVDNIVSKYEHIDIAFTRNGYFETEQQQREVAQEIVRLSPDFLIVGMGIVKQEYFLTLVRSLGYSGIGFSCGGFIHQTAMNRVNYYPKWIDKHNLRFLYRMYKEKHTRKRYFLSSFVFPILFLKERIFDK